MKILTVIAACILIFGCAGRPAQEAPVSKTRTLSLLETEASLPVPADITAFVADPIPTGFLWPDYKITRQMLDEVLTKWHQVSKDQWQHCYSHVGMADRTGTINLKAGTTVQWMVKPGGLATLEISNGTKVYLARSLPFPPR